MSAWAKNMLRRVHLLRYYEVGVGWLKSAVGDGHSSLGAAEGVAVVQQGDQEA
jgi:hypothetical protein